MCFYWKSVVDSNLRELALLAEGRDRDSPEAVDTSDLFSETSDSFPTDGGFQWSADSESEDGDRSSSEETLDTASSAESFESDSIVWEFDNPETSSAVQNRIDQQLPAGFNPDGCIWDPSGQLFLRRNWNDVCGIELLYSDLTYYVSPCPDAWLLLACPVCHQFSQEWDSSSEFVLLTQPLRRSFSDDPCGPAVRTTRLTVQRKLWEPVIVGVIRRQVPLDGQLSACSALLVLDISGFYLARVPCQCTDANQAN